MLLYWLMNNQVNFAKRHPIYTALALAFGAAIALGISRFAYTLFLPLMRADLDWSYLTAGNMNTGNAIGYFLGALICPWIFDRCQLRYVILGAVFVTVFLVATLGFLISAEMIFTIRLLVGITSALIFISGGILAAQLSELHPNQSGWILGIYYGGVGLGIFLASILVNPIEMFASKQGYSHAWQFSWIGIALIASLLMLLMIKPIGSFYILEISTPKSEMIAISKSIWMNLGYLLFGIGHIGYMTFVIAFLKEVGLEASTVSSFYALLGLCLMVSSRLWSTMLDRYRGGEVLAVVNGLMGLACLIPAFIVILLGQVGQNDLLIVIIFISGMLFGLAFITAVSSTTAFIKHNYPVTQWSGGIRLFTILFAIGQMLGPLMIGYIADYGGGLVVGLIVSGVILFLGSFSALQQRPLKILNITKPSK